MSRPKILIADDSLTIQKVFELAFEDEDVEAIIAGDGSTAFDLALAEKPCLVIADAHMPGLDGFQLCNALANNPATSSCPVYLLASSLDEFDEEKAAMVGAAGKFEKPFRSEDIVVKIMEAIKVAPGASEGDHTFDEVDASLETLMEESEEEDAGVEPIIKEATGDYSESADESKNSESASDFADDFYGEEEEPIAEMPQEEVSVAEDLNETEAIDEGQKVDYGKKVAIPMAADISPEDRMLKALEDETAPMDGDEALITGEEAPSSPREYPQEERIGEEEIQRIVEDVVEKTINDIDMSQAIRDSVADGVGEAIAEMKPEIMEAVEKIATSLTLSIAEEMVKKTIEQIKEGQ